MGGMSLTALDSSVALDDVVDARSRVGGTVDLVDLGRTFPGPDGGRAVLRDLTLQIRGGEILAIVGPYGCGKSTLLRVIGGLDRPTAGEITVSGHPVVDTDSRTAIAFQEPRLLPWRTVAENIELGLPSGTGRGPDARGLPSCSTSSGSRHPLTCVRDRSRAAWHSAPPSRARSLVAPRCCCSMSPSARSMP